MTTAKSFLLLSILILTGGTSFTNLYTIDSALAIELECDLEILSQLTCTSGSVNERSSVIAFTGIAQEQKENADVGINDAFASTSNTSQIIAVKNNGENSNDEDDSNMDSNIESQIPSTISAIPFP
jgi:hypothetical protein